MDVFKEDSCRYYLMGFHCVNCGEVWKRDIPKENRVEELSLQQGCEIRNDSSEARLEIIVCPWCECKTTVRKKTNRDLMFTSPHSGLVNHLKDVEDSEANLNA